VRPLGEKVRLGVNFSHHLDDSTLVGHVDALRFMSVVCGAGTVTIRDVAGRMPPLVSSVSSRPFEAQWILELLEDMVYVQTMAGVRFEIPETITSEDAAWFRSAAEVFRTGKTTVRWTGICGHRARLRPAARDGGRRQRRAEHHRDTPRP
jgi:hypothetical protein